MKVRNLRRLLAMVLVIIMVLPTVAFAAESEGWGNQSGNFAPFDVDDPVDAPILIGVTTQDFDNIGAILQNLGIDFQVIEPGQLRDLNILRGFDAVFINCSGNPAINAVPSAPALRQFVSEGGVLYASDLAGPFLAEAFPGLISFTGNYPAGNIQVNVVPTSLRAHMDDRYHLDIILPGGGLIIDEITNQATIYLERELDFQYDDQYYDTPDVGTPAGFAEDDTPAEATYNQYEYVIYEQDTYLPLFDTYFDIPGAATPADFIEDYTLEEAIYDQYEYVSYEPDVYLPLFDAYYDTYDAAAPADLVEDYVSVEEAAYDQHEHVSYEQNVYWPSFNTPDVTEDLVMSNTPAEATYSQHNYVSYEQDIHLPFLDNFHSETNCCDTHNGGHSHEDLAHLLGRVDGIAAFSTGTQYVSASFGYGEGRAYFTAFHHTGQMTDDMVLFLEYIISEMHRDYFAFPRTLLKTRNQHSIAVLNRSTLDPVEAANVNVGGTILSTNDLGAAFYDVTTPGQLRRVEVTAPGYRRNIQRYLVNPRQTRVFAMEIAVNDNRPYITMVSDTAGHTDLRVSERQFAANSTQTINLQVAGDWGANPAGSIRLVQNNAAGTEIVSVSGTPINGDPDGAFLFSFAPGTTLTPGRPVSLVMTAANGVTSAPVNVNLRVIPNNPITQQFGNIFNNVHTMNSLQIIPNLAANNPGGQLATMFPLNFSGQATLLPVELYAKTDANGYQTLRLTIGLLTGSNNDILADDQQWSTFKDSIQGAVNPQRRRQVMQQFRDRLDPQKPTKIGVELDFMAAGFAEIKLDTNGNIKSAEGGIIITAEGGVKIGNTFLLGPVPVYFELKLAAGAEGRIGLTFYTSSDGLGMTPSGSLTVTIPKVTVGGGVGVRRVASVGVSGTAMLNMGIVPVFRGEIDAYASVNIRVLFVANFSWRFARTRPPIHLWGPNPAMAAFGFDMFDMQESMTAVSRAYNAHTTPWQGSPMFVPFGAANTMHTLQSSILPDSLPQIVQVGNDLVMLFLYDDSTRASGDHTVLMYSVNSNGAWSTPQPVWAGSDTGDMFFSAAVVNNELYVVWQKQSQQVTQSGLDDLIEELARNSEIAFARFDSTAGVFTDHVFVTDNLVMDLLPTVAANGGVATAVWVRDNLNDPFAEINGASSSSAIYRSVNTGGNSFAPETRMFSTDMLITELATGYVNNQLRVVFTADNKIYTLNGSGGATLLSEASVTSSALQFDGNRFFWASEGNIFSFNPVTNNVTQVGQEYTIIPAAYRVVSNQTENAVVWIETYESNFNVMAAMQTAGGWSYPINLLTTGEDIIDHLDVILTNDYWYLALGTRDADTDISSLVFATIEREPDTELVYVFADSREETNGLQPLHLLVRNLGDTTVSSFPVTVTDGLTNWHSETISHTLIPGEESIVTVNMDVSALNNVTDFVVTAAAVGETDTSNNFANIQLGQVDVSVELSSHRLGDYVLVTARVSNDSGTPANTTIQLREDSADGTIVDTRSVGLVNNAQDFVYIYRMNLRDINFGGAASKAYFFTVDTLEPNREIIANSAIIVLYPLENELPQLPAPGGLSITGTVLSWNAVSGSIGYRVYVGGQAVGEIISFASFNLANLNLGIGIHPVQVRALGDGISSANSILSEPEIFTVVEPPIVTPQPTPQPTPPPVQPTPPPTQPAPQPTPIPQAPPQVAAATPQASAGISQSSVNFDLSRPRDITITLRMDRSSLRNLRHNNVNLEEGTDYTVDGNEVTIRANFLSTLEPGRRVITFLMSEGNNPTLTVNVRGTAGAAGVGDIVDATDDADAEFAEDDTDVTAPVPTDTAATAEDTAPVEADNNFANIAEAAHTGRWLSLSLDSYFIIDLSGNTQPQVMDVLPVIQDGRTLIPIRFIAEALGADIDWTAATDHAPLTVYVRMNGQTLNVPVGEITPQLAALGMDVPAQLINDRTMLPLRFVSEFFGAVVNWNDDTRSIEIISAGSGITQQEILRLQAQAR